MIDSNVGFYVCNEKYFTSKIEACIYSQQSNFPISWIFHNNTYMKYDWTVEPEMTLDQLYDLRAREIREKYDYVILSYSGGADSNNIVESFIRQNLFIDEIITTHITDATKSVTTLDKNVTSAYNFAAEHQLHAIPRLKELYNRLPKTKFTLIDMSERVYYSIRKENDVDWILKTRENLAIGQVFRYDFFNTSDLRYNLDKGKTSVIVTGVDKPKTFITNNNELYVFFNDGTANITPILDYNEHPNLTVEFFYWGATSAAVVCKQAHVILNSINANPRLHEIWKNQTYKKSRLIIEPIVRDLVYTTWHPDWFQTKKSVGMWYNNEFETWFYKTKKESRDYRLWSDGIQYLIKHAPSYIKYESGRPAGLKSFQHNYLIGSVNTVNSIR
jgi:hypothetical protein